MNKILNYWNDEKTESMYDKHLLNLEIAKIACRIPFNSRILDVGCGEGEGTLEYSKIPGVTIDAIDFSETRLKKAKERLCSIDNVNFKKIDITSAQSEDLDEYDVIISQRCLINIESFDKQKKAMEFLCSKLKFNGRLFLLEGSLNGVNELNKERELFSLPAIPMRWHNLFFEDKQLTDFVLSLKLKHFKTIGFGEYFYLTRCVAPSININHNWNTNFNEIIAKTKGLSDDNEKFSRLKLWYFIK